MPGSSTDYAQTLRDAGLRATQQRIAVMAILTAAEDHPTADEVWSRAKEVDDSVSLATVYRTLGSLEEASLVRKINLEGESARYEKTPLLEHDHLIDIDTGEVIEVFSEEMGRLRQEMVTKLGFEIVSYHSVIRARRV